MFNLHQLRIGLSAAAIAIACGQAADAAVHEVSLVGFTFIPADITIEQGDTVHWAWNDGFHNVESGVGGIHDDNFRSGNPGGIGDFSVTFDETFLAANPVPGDVYPFYCAVHVGFGMIGSITVNAALPCDEDTDGNGAVDVDDLINIILDWNTDGSGNGGDVNGSGNVDVDDLVQVILAFGDCP